MTDAMWPLTQRYLRDISTVKNACQCHVSLLNTHTQYAALMYCFGWIISCHSMLFVCKAETLRDKMKNARAKAKKEQTVIFCVDIFFF